MQATLKPRIMICRVYVSAYFIFVNAVVVCGPSSLFCDVIAHVSKPGRRRIPIWSSVRRGRFCDRRINYFLHETRCYIVWVKQEAQFDWRPELTKRTFLTLVWGISCEVRGLQKHFPTAMVVIFLPVLRSLIISREGSIPLLTRIR